MVTGHDSTSDLIIAAWLTLLKSDHSALSPVRFTDTVDVASFASGAVSASAARTIALASPAAPAWTIAVVPSRDSETPGLGERPPTPAGRPAAAPRPCARRAARPGPARSARCRRGRRPAGRSRRDRRSSSRSPPAPPPTGCPSPASRRRTAPTRPSARTRRTTAEDEQPAHEHNAQVTGGPASEPGETFACSFVRRRGLLARAASESSRSTAQLSPAVRGTVFGQLAWMASVHPISARKASGCLNGLAARR